MRAALNGVACVGKRLVWVTGEAAKRATEKAMANSRWPVFMANGPAMVGMPMFARG